MNIGGSVIMARTADEDGRNLRGHSADRVIVDEAAYVKDSVILEVISPMLADRDGEPVSYTHLDVYKRQEYDKHNNYDKIR